MNKITIVNDMSSIDIIISKIKYIFGNDYEKKDKIIKVLTNYFNKLPNSDYAQEKGITSMVKLDDEPLNISNYLYFYVSCNYDLSLDIKLGSKSISLAYLNALLNDVEYNETFQTISFLFHSLVDELNEEREERVIPNFDIDFQKKTLIKLFTAFAIKEDSNINEYDLSLEERINIQLDMINTISKSSNKKVLIVVDTPILYQSTDKILEDINAISIVFFENIQKEGFFDFLCLNRDLFIDVMNDNAIFELCNSYHNHITINEMKEKLFDVYIKPRVFK